MRTSNHSVAATPFHLQGRVSSSRQVDKDEAVDKEKMNKKYEEILRLKKQQEELTLKMQQRVTMIQEVITVNRLTVNFTAGFPGEVLEECVEVTTRGNDEITYKVHVLCDEPDLASLDEYVFSMRKTGGYDYNDKYLIMQSPGVKSTYKVALKVPDSNKERPLRGKLLFFSDDLKGKLIVPIQAKVVHK
jgi:hypothetical protein